MVSCQTSNGVSRKGILRSMPALLTMMSRRPKASVAFWTRASTSFGSETSAPTTNPLPPDVFDLLDHLLGRVGIVRVIDDHGGTLRGEGERYRFPYPRGRSRDHRHLVLEPHAGLLVFLLRQHVYE